MHKQDGHLLGLQPYTLISEPISPQLNLPSSTAANITVICRMDR